MTTPLSRPGTAELRLPASARSAGEARRFVREQLLAAGRERWVDDAELAVSEVVTNGVLHAHTDLVLRVEVGEDAVTVEVSDSNPALPQQRTGSSTSATTGRGLGLVSALSRDCGVRPEPTGKTVWFVVGDGPAPDDVDEDDLLAAWDLDDEAPADLPAATVEVHLLGLPPTLWMAAREHHQSLLRELVLYLAEHDVADPPDLVAADAARATIWTALLAAVEEARADGRAARPVPHGHPSPLPEVPAAVDLVLHVAPDAGPSFQAVQDALDTGERLAREDRLLVRPGLPEVVAVRDWACEQVVAQLNGVPPSAWGGTDHTRFTEAVDATGDLAWDDTGVSTSERGVVAADDANRIVAISRPLAARLGWEPEELVGRRVVVLIPPVLREAHVAGFSRHLTTGQSHVLGVPLELPVLHRDGSHVTCSFLVERADAGSRPVYLAWIEPV